MMIPCFRCKNCETDWIIDIYTQSNDGIIQKFINSMCCPICGKKDLRVCFLQKVENKYSNNFQNSNIYNDELGYSLV